MLVKIHKSRFCKTIAVLLMMSFFGEWLLPYASAAPSVQNTIQVENMPTSQANDNEYVDMYSGDFKYNISLMAIPGPNGGYPLNLSYNSNVGMETEASWVGLGWNLNIGAISRELRGIPDDYSGESITYENHFRKYESKSISFPTGGGGKSELFGYPVPPLTGSSIPFSFTPTLYWNNYYGAGYNLGLSYSTGYPYVLGASLGLSFDSQNGIGYSGGFDAGMTNKLYGKFSLGGGLSFNGNTRTGMNQLSFAATYQDKSVNIGYSINQPVPKVNFPYKNVSKSGGIHVGRADTYLGVPFGYFRAKNFVYLSLNGNITKTEPSPESISKSALGYLNMNTSSALGDPDKYNGFVKDFNRAPIDYNQKIPNLPPAYITPDNFIISGQGIGGTFKASKSDIGILNDAKVEFTNTNTSKSVEAGVELSHYSSGIPYPAFSPDYIHLGLDKSTGFANNRSGAWNSGSTALTDLLKPSSSSEPVIPREPYCFKMTNEVNGESMTGNFYDAWGKDEALRPKLVNSGSWSNRHYVTTGALTADGSATTTISASSMSLKKQRQVRNTLVYGYNRSEAKSFGKEKDQTFVAYTGGTDLNHSGNYTSKNKYTDVYNGAYQNQLSELNIVKTDGTHYTYGLPVYVHSQKDVLFSDPYDGGNTTKLSAVASNTYLQSISAGLETHQTKYVTSLSPYPCSWLLTSMHSDDYVDLTSDGVSDDDYGFWLKFNYRRIYDNFRWRNPVNDAYYNKGKHTDKKDNTVFFSTGTKDVTYIENIETKTHIAKFYISKRKDAIEPTSEYSYSDPTDLNSVRSLCKLDSIRLFVKSEYTSSPSTAVPIQVVVFEYDYSMCPNYISNIDYPGGGANSGKLTLKKLYIYTENSKRGVQSPYVFNYLTSAVNDKLYPESPNLTTMNNNENPSYSSLNVDRWGFYTNNSSLYSSGNYPVVMMPYTEQGANTTNPEDFRHASAWTIKEVTTPTGAKLSVRYESDDYAYVEGEPAQAMFDIASISGYSSDSRNPGSAPTGNAANLMDNDYKVYFKLDHPVSLSTPSEKEEYIRKNYLKGMRFIYFKIKINLVNNIVESCWTGSEYEYVSGYARLNTGAGTCGIDNTTGYGWFQVMPETIAEGVYNAHPFRKAAWQFLKLERPDLLFCLNEPTGDMASVLISLGGGAVANAQEIYTMMAGGYYAFCMYHDLADKMILNGHSKVRLCEPDKRKYGGGSRVKKILVSDGWKEKTTSTNEEAFYGEEYFYDLVGDGTGASSGVGYEPELGGDENAMLEPVPYEDSHWLRTSYDLFMEKPILKALYPPAGIGYSKVTVRSIAPQVAGPSVHIEPSAAPYTVYEFYTPKDFPVLTDQTDLSVNVPNDIADGTFGINATVRNNLSRSQGYSIVLNDMAGKLKKISTYKRFPFNDEGNFLASTTYNYHTVAPYDPNSSWGNKLKNNLTALKATNVTGSIQKKMEQAYLGIDEEIFFDFNENYYKYSEFTNEKNLDIWITEFPIGVIPIPVPTWYNSDYKQEQYFRHVTCTKVIRKTGILKEVVENNQGAITRNEMLAYDFYTGDPVLTKTNDQFKQPVYNLAYKGYWAYPNMGGKYTTQNLSIAHSTNSITYSSGTLSISGIGSYADYFKIGDLVYVDPNGAGTSAQMLHVYEVLGSGIRLQEADGDVATIGSFSAEGYIKIVEPATKNLWDIGCGGLSAREMNVDGSGIVTFKKIINASASTFRDEWPTFMYSSCGLASSPTGTFNPFALGVKGAWRPVCTFAYLTNRTYTGDQQDEGFFDGFNEFNWVTVSDAKWIVQGSNTLYSPHGFLLEAKKQLATSNSTIYSSSDYNNKYHFMNATCSNSEYNEFYFNSFEELNLAYDVNDCKHDKMDLTQVYAHTSDYEISTGQQHTGKQSLLVETGPFILQSNLTESATEEQGKTLCENCVSQGTVMPNINPPGTPQEDLPAMSSCSGLKKLYLKPNETYQVSCWVKSTPNSSYTYTQPLVRVYNPSTSATIASGTPSGKIIEGWQRISFSFTVPSGYNTILQFRLETSGAASYFDDFRVQPLNSEMQAYVYDLNTLKLRAVLDGENFATFYGYDQGGVLQKMRKETIDGIKTISETRGSTHVH